MATQSEQTLENNLISQLSGMGYAYVTLKDEAALLANLKSQLEKHNKCQLTDTEFAQVLNYLNKGNVFEKASRLRDRFEVKRTDKPSVYLQFINQEFWCQNEYQVTNQITLTGRRTNRYDVTILVNGLPLCHIELKKRGVELKKAFNQINRYHRDSFTAAYGLFQYVQIFVISNGVNAVYYANNREQSFKQTSYWTDEKNNRISKLDDFATVFLEPCHLSKMICKYIVQHQSSKVLMILRPYQFYAVEKIFKLVKESKHNGYVWHTTGSGKTLTSFKASQLLSELGEVHKVVFVVDRNDLDYQTQREFNEFADGSVDGSINTRILVDQLLDRYIEPGTKQYKQNKLIVTTIQKLSRAVKSKKYSEALAPLQNKKIVFIFDECHRSQFGKTQANIQRFFTNHQLIGFTGTPILDENKVNNQYGKWTTVAIFDQCIHKYQITNAIRDKKVLPFAIEYVGRYTQKDGSEVDLDIEVEDIDTKEVLTSDSRIDKIVDHIITHHNRRTKNKKFSSILCTSDVNMAIQYYEKFKSKQHDLRVAAIFSTGEANPDADGEDDIPDVDDVSVETMPLDKLDKLNDCVSDYNKLFGTNWSLKDRTGFISYKNDISKRLKDRERASFQDKDRLDILIVAYMFLTGFDAKMINTLYVDKNLKLHGLIQAFSRTNRIKGSVKSHGQIVCYRNLKKATDKAIEIFSDPNARETVLMLPYQEYVRKMEEAVDNLLEIAPTPESVHELFSEEDIRSFVLAFREVLRNRNIMMGFSQYDPNDLALDEQLLDDFKSMYLDVRERPQERERASIVDEVDFELELMQLDVIDVTYILNLIAALHQEEEAEEQQRQREQIERILGNEISLRPKRQLIEQFIDKHLKDIANTADIPQSFEEYWAKERQKAIDSFSGSENLDKEGFEKTINEYLYTGHPPLSKTVNELFIDQLTFLEKRKKAKAVIDWIVNFVETFEDNWE